MTLRSDDSGCSNPLFSMKMFRIAPHLNSLLALAALSIALPAFSHAEENLFNGKSLDGWRGDPRLWRVENGVLIGETDGSGRKIARNSFLVWQGGDVGNFELTLQVRVTGDNNSGVQYRSRLADPETFVVQGYQMDLHPRPEYAAMLYEEGGRGIVAPRGQAVTIAADGTRQTEALIDGNLPPVDVSAWNEFKVIARGDTVTHWVNGNLAARITDLETGKFARSGILALQLHAGAPMRAEFKDIVLKRLPDEPRAQWIWSREQAGENEQVFFERSFSIPASESVTSAILLSAADNEHEVFLNGKSIGKSDGWQTPFLTEISKRLPSAGPHTIRVLAANKGGPAGFAFRLELLFTSGNKQTILSDESWEWTAADNDENGRRPVAVLGEMGVQPWGDVFAGWGSANQEQAPTDVSADYQLLPGFRLEHLYEVPKAFGSWVAMTVDPEGRLIASDQYGGLYRITVGATTAAERLPLPIHGAQGLLWAHDSLYIVTSIGDMGVFRATDTDGDGELDHVEKLKELDGAGEHGPHSLVLSPDGEWIYFVAGNHTKPAPVDHSMVPEVWDEDQLLPRRPDARGHARDVMAPGGWVVRFTPDGKYWERVSTGYRNAYDIAFDEHGELFTWDSDMEWDMGMPWYRPTRINHITSGSAFGWRNGTGKWPEYYEDSLPGILDIGPGSPTGIVAGKGLRFPARYQRAIYMLDWTYATIYAVHLTPSGATYTAETEELVAGTGLPVTDAVVGQDGALYFLIGGRRTNSALFRITYVGDESTAAVQEPAPIDPEAERLGTLRRELEALHRHPDPAALDAIWEALDHEDRFIRFAARVALEHLPVSTWKARLSEENTPWQAILAAIALARVGEAPDKAVGLAALDRVDPTSIDEQRQVNLLRAYGLLFIRHGEPAPSVRANLIERFDGMYPADKDNLNRELCRMLTYLKAPNVLAKTLRLMAVPTPNEAPQWAALASRNKEYGEPIAEMIENMPSEQNLFYAYCLRTLEGPWTAGQRRQFFTWLGEAAKKSGGRSYGGFIEDMRQETLQRATPEERKMIESWDLKPAANPFADLPPVEGPGRAWTVEEAVAAAEKGLVNRDLARGKQMFHATLCAACHRFNGEGGATGPDLTSIGARFSIADLVDAIINPNNAVSDQYQFDLIALKDGSSVTGKVLNEEKGVLTVGTSPFDFTQTRKIERSLIHSVEPSPVSPMPGGLLNRLNEDELRDLLAYLLRRE